MTGAAPLAFVGTYTDADADGLFGVRLGEDGELTRTSAMSGGPDPTYLAVHPSLDVLYAATRPGERAEIVSFAVEHDAGSLSRLDTVDTEGGETPCYCSVDATGEWLFTAHYHGGRVSVQPIDEDGVALESTDVVEHTGSGPVSERQSEAHPHSILAGPDNRYVYAPDLGADRVFVYDLNSEAGELEPADCGHLDVHAGAGPRHLEFHPDLDVAYLINELDSTVSVCEWDSETGALSEVDTVSTLDPETDPSGNAPADVHVHPSGEYLYGSNRGDDSIAAYALDDDGHPTLLETTPTGGEKPRDFAISPDGRFLIAENRDTDDVYTFRIGDDGRLEATGASLSLPSPVCLQFVSE